MPRGCQTPKHREAISQAKKEWWQQHPTMYRSNTHKKEVRGQMFAIIKKEMGCIRCGYNECAEALEFHHRSPSDKRKEVSKMKDGNIQTIQAEINKCDVLCANCHVQVSL